MFPFPFFCNLRADCHMRQLFDNRPGNTKARLMDCWTNVFLSSLFFFFAMKQQGSSLLAIFFLWKLLLPGYWIDQTPSSRKCCSPHHHRVQKDAAFRVPETAQKSSLNIIGVYLNFMVAFWRGPNVVFRCPGANTFHKISCIDTIWCFRSYLDCQPGTWSILPHNRDDNLKFKSVK